ncbi:hypothetical protein C2S51_038449 [Perilla frutescens var. frutescens]|nr:hypothetical protein C2S51_038449 [Perilla frutescens var. frutescens]
MLRFLGKTTASAARSGGSSLAQVCGGGDDGLSTWELVNAAQSDDEDLYSYDSDEAVITADAVSGDDLEPVLTEDDDDVDVEEDAPAPRDFVSPSDIIAIQAMSVSPPMTLPVVMARDLVAPEGEIWEAEDNEDGDKEDGAEGRAKAQSKEASLLR